MYKEITSLMVPYNFYDLKRYGSKNKTDGHLDGSYVLSESLLNSTNIIYSYGIGGDHWVTFDLEMAELGKKIFMYDGTINFTIQNPNFVFKKENVNSKNILEHIKDNGHENETDMILKMDIDIAEYETLINCDEKLFSHFNQISIEIHDLTNNNTSTEDKIKLLTRLNKHYTLVHIHGNNHGDYDSNYGVPEAVENLYIRKDRCPSIMSVRTKPFPIEGLDIPNTIHRPDYPINWWLEHE